MGGRTVVGIGPEEPGSHWLGTVWERDFATRSLPPLHTVICNAGIQVSSGTTYTQDGVPTFFPTKIPAKSA